MDISIPKKQKSIAALSNAAILQDMSLVEDYSDIRKIQRLPEDQSVSGSVVITPKTQQHEGIRSNVSSTYSEDNRIVEDNEGSISDLDNDKDSFHEKKVSHSKGSIELDSKTLQEDLNNNIHDNKYTESEKEQEIVDSRSGQYLTSHKMNEADLSSHDDRDSEHESHIEMGYSDSDFEDNLHQRMRDLENDGDSFDDRDTPISEEASTKFDFSDEDEEQYFEDELGEDEYRPLPPPKELDPEKLYALYAFNGPDNSHCQLEQDEDCVLLNDEDSYWWLVKRCRDSRIGFAPAEILETFPERLARLNCWKNENVSASSQSLDEINKKEKLEQQSSENSSKTSGLPEKLPYQKNSKSVSFNDIVNYADRFIEISDAEDEDQPKTIRTKHYDKFSDEKLQFNEKDDVSDVVSDTSFNQAFTQPLNITKIRESKSIKNIRNEMSELLDKNLIGLNDNEKDTGLNKKYTTDVVDGILENIQMGINENYIDAKSNTKEIDTTYTNYDLADTQLNEVESVGHQTSGKENFDKSLDNKILVRSNDEVYVNDLSNEEDVDDLERVFEAPVLPFSKSKRPEGQNMHVSNSNYSISTIGEYSPSSSEWTNDSPKLQSNTFEIQKESKDTATIPSSSAIQDISKLVDNDEAVSNNAHTNTDINDNLSNLNNEESNNELKKSERILNTPPIENIAEKHRNISHSPDSSVSDEFKMESDRQLASATSIISMESISKGELDIEPKEVGKELTPANDGSKHPIVEEIYKPVFSQIECLMNKLEQLTK